MANDGVLKDKVGVIFGASRGIGQEFARAFVAEGAKLMLVARNLEGLQAVAKELDAGDRVQVIRADMADAATVEAAVKATVEAFGRLDIAINNAGVQVGPDMRVPLTELPDEEFDKLISVNLRGVFVAMKHEIRAMLQTGGGAVLNIASAAGLVGLPLIAPYVASKHGLIGLTKAAAIEFASQGVRVNALAPGTVMTEMLRQGPASTPELKAKFTARIPMGRIAEVNEVSGAAIWLCSDAASYVTGVTLPVDGGFVI